MSIDWTGGYRLEYTDIDGPTLATPGGKKNYANHYLYLSPKLVASDGINIVSRFDIMGSQAPEYQNSQLGAFLGTGVGGATGQNATAQTSDSTNIRVSQLYLNMQDEYGELVAGRAPLHFGMGITHNAGLGMFDHWMDTRDLLLYRFKVDNVYFMPIFAKVKQANHEIGNTVSEMTYVFEYDNKDIGAKTGVFYQTRTGGDLSNDFGAAGLPGAVGGTNSGFSLKTVNLFLERVWPTFEVRVEGSFLTGTTGLTTATEEINVDAFAVVSEFSFPQQNESSIAWGARLGAVSGDDPTTAKYEGYQLDRNYDVALLMFNHRLGQADFMTSGVNRSGYPVTNTVANSADDESIGNAMFLSPHLTYAWSDKLDLKTTFTYAQLMANPGNFADFQKDLGYELDLEVIYKTRERVTWSNALGLLQPGQAFTGGSNNFDNKMTWGFVSRLGITF